MMDKETEKQQTNFERLEEKLAESILREPGDSNMARLNKLWAKSFLGAIKNLPNSEVK